MPAVTEVSHSAICCSSDAAWLAEERRGDTAIPELSVAQIQDQLGRSADRVMAEGSLYDRQLAALDCCSLVSE